MKKVSEQVSEPRRCLIPGHQVLQVIRSQRALDLRAMSTNASKMMPPNSINSMVKKSISRYDVSSIDSLFEPLNTVVFPF